ncbi:MAG: 2-oxo acid dehydrogenase subunit E2 [Polyangiaceae bacterium]
MTAPDASGPPPDRIERLPLGERWIPDAFQVMHGPGGFALRLADMTRCALALKLLRDQGVRVTYTHFVVRATALALARNPELHQIVSRYHRLTPGAVDIGLSMAGETTYAPVVVLAAADRQPLGALVPMMDAAIAAARIKEKADLANMRKMGWLIPFGVIRRFFLRWFGAYFWFRRRLVGTFQVSCLPSVDIVTSFLFYTGAILGAGSVCDRVVALDGQPVVRTAVWLTVCIDHMAMDGRRAGDLLNAVKQILEGDELLVEAREACARRATEAA